MAANLISSARPSVLHRAALGVGRVFRLQKHQLLVSSNHPCLWISRDKLWECRSGCAHSSRRQRGSPPPLLSSLHSGHETTAVQQHFSNNSVLGWPWLLLFPAQNICRSTFLLPFYSVRNRFAVRQDSGSPRLAVNSDRRGGLSPAPSLGCFLCARVSHIFSFSAGVIVLQRRRK